MSAKPTTVEVRVRQYGGAYHARAGTGLAAKLASSTMSAACAASAAADKYLHPWARGTFLICTAVEGTNQHGSLFQAKKGRA